MDLVNSATMNGLRSRIMDVRSQLPDLEGDVLDLILPSELQLLSMKQVRTACVMNGCWCSNCRHPSGLVPQLQDEGMGPTA